jgi:hypothetical protein
MSFLSKILKTAALAAILTLIMFGSSLQAGMTGLGDAGTGPAKNAPMSSVPLHKTLLCIPGMSLANCNSCYAACKAKCKPGAAQCESACQAEVRKCVDAIPN